MTIQESKRKLAAILSADVKGYSRLMSQDEEATVKSLKQHRATISGLVSEHRGRVVDSPGDNILAEFGSVVDAVKCAVKIQETLKGKNAELPENRRMEFRIGVNLGDVIEEEERIYGDGLNIAARLEGLAEAGGICISGTAFDQVKTKIPVGYQYLGKQTVKNIPDPVRAYKVLMEPESAGKVIGEKGPRRTQWRWTVAAAVVLVAGGLALWNFHFRPPPIEPASKEKMAFALPEKPSIAVLPFVNMTGDPRQEFFCDGVSEDIITALSKVPRLFVIARNSTFSFKGKPVKVQQVSEELGVQYVLEGSIQKSGDRVRVTAQLIDALKGHHLWAERFERGFNDLFAIQDSITKAIITAVNVKLTEGEQAHVFSRGTENLESYLKIMEARWLRLQGSREGVTRAKKLAEEAITLDPQYALAYSSLGNSHMMEVWLGLSKSPKESLERNLGLQKKAVALDNTSAIAHVSLGNAYAMLRQYDQSIAEGEKGYALEPNTADVLMGYGTILCWSSRFDQAIPLFKEAIRLDPKPPSYYPRWLSIAFRETGKYDEAISLAKKAIELEPNDLISHGALTAAYAYAGREEEARTAAREILRINPNFNIQGYPTGTFKDPAVSARIQKAFRSAGLPEKPPLPLPDKPSIAVLPFVNMSDDKSQEFFSDGLTEEIITALSKTPKLFVIARNSSFVYRGKPVNVQQVSRELGVKYVLEGSVRRSGDQLRITAQLIDATTGNHLWAERYDREMKAIFAIQDEVTMKILTSLQVTLTEGESARFLAAGANNLEAYLKTLEARQLMYRLNKDDTALSIRRCEEAIALDPQFSGAFAVLSSAYSLRFGFGISPQESLGKAYEFAKKAISLDQTQLAAYTALEFVCGFKRQYEEAINAGEQAIKVAPGSADAYLALGRALNFSCRDEEAKSHLEKAIRMNPYPPSHYYMHLGWAQFNLRQYEQAVSSLKKAISISPRNQPARLGLIASYVEMNKLEEAKSESEELLKIDPRYTSKGYEKRAAWKDPRVMERWVEALRKAGLERDMVTN